MKALGILAVAAAAATASVQADIIYVDIDTSNTLAWDAGSSTYTTFTTSGAIDFQGPAGDGLWDIRTFANNATIFQNAGTSAAPDDAQRLQTTVSVAENAYHVFAYFWSDTSNTWTLEASLSDNVGGDLTVYNPSNADVQWYSGSDATVFSDDASVNGGVNPFTTPVMVAEGNRRLYQVNLGQVTGSSITVYLDDWSDMTVQSDRTWLDGIGYEVVPEPSTFILGLFGAALLMIRRRRSTI